MPSHVTTAVLQNIPKIHKSITAKKKEEVRYPKSNNKRKRARGRERERHTGSRRSAIYR